MNSSPQTVLERRKDRRGVLALIGAGGGAAAAALLGGEKRARAATGDALIIGQSNQADDNHWTGLTAKVDEGPTLDVMNTSTGLAHGIIAHTYGVKSAILGESWGAGPGIGIAGASSTPDPDGFGKGAGTGVSGVSGSGGGVAGFSESGHGVFGGSSSGTGVLGHSDSDAGVRGHSNTGPGVSGISESDVGVTGLGRGRGTAGVSGMSMGIAGAGVAGAADEAGSTGVVGKSTNGVGVSAHSQAGIALDVAGKARFSTCGAGTIPQGENSKFVPNAAVTGLSHISVTLTSNPALREVRWVERVPGSGFRVYLTPAVLRPATNFTYLIVEPGSP